MGRRACVHQLALDYWEPPTPQPPGFTFFTGAPQPSWAWRYRCNFFISRSTLVADRKNPAKARVIALQPAKEEVGIDAETFSIMSKYGNYDSMPADQWAQHAREICAGLQRVRMVSIQDWMTETPVLKLTGPWPDAETAIRVHQERTIDSYITLRSLAPDVKWMPVLQGNKPWQYVAHAERFEKRGINLNDPEIPVIGVGSMCRRGSKPEGLAVIRAIAGMGLRMDLPQAKRFHILGWMVEGVEDTAADPEMWKVMGSSDSMKWSKDARDYHIYLPDCRHGEYEPREMLGYAKDWGNCASCVRYAIVSRNAALTRVKNALSNWQPADNSDVFTTRALPAGEEA
jgi:hypothetical protein